MRVPQALTISQIALLLEFNQLLDMPKGAHFIQVGN
jgi:hypothetical protein